MKHTRRFLVESGKFLLLAFVLASFVVGATLILGVAWQRWAPKHPRPRPSAPPVAASAETRPDSHPPPQAWEAPAISADAPGTTAKVLVYRDDDGVWCADVVTRCDSGASTGWLFGTRGKTKAEALAALEPVKRAIEEVTP